MASNDSQIAFWSAVSALGSALLTGAFAAFTIWLRNRNALDANHAATTRRLTLSDREQMDRLIDDMRTQLQSTQADLRETNKRLESMQAQDASLQSKVAALERDKTYLADQVADRDRRIAQQEQHITQLDARIVSLETQLAKLTRGRP